ncbi:peptidoglycan/LPS O-acetylase OafA/YrhL [Microbacterium sp. 1154]|uniref:acyltransferase family protein n=1 Tax=Microbacterium sp. 1154 TaxID=2817733 RepID=UPI0028639C80|nr:acyltransferase [Microbacterium sp. 1154]MDR6691329.1 peptidoglycan/LPS O-acetylase OafA/YrhL [Microbacterium sp. 1154]
MTMGQAIPERVFLDRLTSLRFFAALVVVLNHITREFAPIPGVSTLAVLGTTGVGFFFALSGFILTWNLRNDDTPGRFYRRRFARVYPMHFVTLLIAVPVLLWTGSRITAPEAITNALLVQSWVPDRDVYFGMNAPSWSLACEAFFYLAFPFVIPVLRRLTARSARNAVIALVAADLLIAAAVTVALGVGDLSSFLLYVFPPFRIIGFLAGCALALWMKEGVRISHPLWIPTLALGVAYCGLAGAQVAFGPAGHGIEDAILLPFVLWLIAAAGYSDLSGKPGWLRSRMAIRLGEWSFALYLTHWLLMTVAVHLFPSVYEATILVRVGADLVFVAIAVGVSAFFYYAVEAPLEKRLRGARPRPAMEVSTG